MTPNVKRVLAWFCVCTAMMLCVCFYLLVFTVPVLEESWQDSDLPLSVTQRAMCSLSNTVRCAGTLVLPLLLAAAIGSIAWVILVNKKIKNDRLANNQIQNTGTNAPDSDL